MDPLRVLVVDDHPLFRKGVAALLGVRAGRSRSRAGHHRRGGGRSGGGAAAGRRPDGPAAARASAASRPPGPIVAADPDVRVLVLTLFEDDDSVFPALRAGARGYVLKDADEDELTGAVRAVARGEAIFSPAVAGRVLAFFAQPRATPEGVPRADRPRAGDPRADRAGPAQPGDRRGRCSLSPKTVANYVSAIFAKLQVADRAQAMIRAREAGLR